MRGGFRRRFGLFSTAAAFRNLVRNLHRDHRMKKRSFPSQPAEKSAWSLQKGRRARDRKNDVKIIRIMPPRKGRMTTKATVLITPTVALRVVKPIHIPNQPRA